MRCILNLYIGEKMKKEKIKYKPIPKPNEKYLAEIISGFEITDSKIKEITDQKRKPKN